MSKIIQSGKFLGKMISHIIPNLGRRAFLDFGVHVAKNILPTFKAKATSSALDKFERKINGQGDVRSGIGFILFISNRDMDDIIKGKACKHKMVC